MRGAYRSIALGILGWLLLASVDPGHDGHFVAKSSAMNAQNVNSSPSETPAAAPYTPYPRVNDPHCYEASDHDAADLCAQWRAAIAAERAANGAGLANWIGATSAVLSFISTVLVLIALAQTRTANKFSQMEYDASREEAKTARLQTIDAIKISRKQQEESYRIAQFQSRPYVSLSNIRILSPKNDVNRPVVIADIKNYGTTIGLNVQKKYAVVVTNNPPPPGFVRDLQLHETPYASDMAPGHESQLIAPIPASAWQHIEYIKKRTIGIFVYISFSYEDLFGNTHENDYYGVYFGDPTGALTTDLERT